MDKIFNLPLTLFRDFDSEKTKLDIEVDEVSPTNESLLDFRTQAYEEESLSNSTSQADSYTNSSSSIDPLRKNTRKFYQVKPQAEITEFFT